MNDNDTANLWTPPCSRSSAYQEYRLLISRNYMHFLIIVVCVINLLLLVPDLILIEDAGARRAILIIRVAYSLFLFILSFRIREIKVFKLFYAFVTVCEILAYAIFLFVLCQYVRPNFMIQAMGLITLIIINFFVPNLWIITLLTAGLGSAGFFIVSALLLANAGTVDYYAAVAYAAIALLLCAISAKSAETHQCREFMAKRELERQSSTDYLTKAATRYKIEEEAIRWMDFCQRNKLPLSLVFIDVDNLKTVNDQYGHPAGDHVLLSLAKLIKNQLRSSDTLARWGGDEFVMLFPNVSLSDAVKITERIRAKIRESTFINDVDITCSFGIAEMNPHSDFKDLLGRADKLMYQSKTQGKDSVLY